MILKTEQVSKSFSQGENTIQVLNNLSLEIQKGESIAILGQSGSGKSTLLSLLAGLDTPNSGSIYFAGKDITQIPEGERTLLRAQKIGIVFQQFHLLPHLNVFENVCLKLEIAQKYKAYPKDSSLKTQEVGRNILEEVGLQNRLSHFPHELSGGEKQRVALARALITNPLLLLADEPSGSLDKTTGDKVTKILFDAVKEREMSLLLVTHNNDLAKSCDRILYLEQGLLRTLCS